jgi:streptomycin 6-kinase
LRDLEQLSGATCSLVYSAKREGEAVVLKIPLDEEEATSGFRTSLAFAGHGGVQVLEADEDSGSLLMPALGVSLSDTGLDDEECVRVCADLIRQLQRTPGIEVQPLDIWFRDLLEPSCSGEDEGWIRARSVAERLLETTTCRVLLHGDLHHFNILQSSDGWLAIDPKGVIGDPAFEPSAFLRNPIPKITDWPDLEDVMRRRIELFARELDLSPARVWGWGFAQTTLASLWAEDGFGDDWRNLAKVLESFSWSYESGI